MSFFVVSITLSEAEPARTEAHGIKGSYDTFDLINAVFEIGQKQEVVS